MKLSLVSSLFVLSVSVAACSSGSDNACSGAGQALTVCATGTTVKGVDVSKYQGTINWSSAKSAGVVFGIARMSDGLNYPDADFATNWKNMKAQGLVRGVYQFFEPAQDPTQQANMLLNAVKNAGGFVPEDLPPVMDIEVTGSQSPSTIQAHMQTWLDVIEKAIGRKPIIYTALFMSSNIGSGFGKYPLWVANWGVSCPSLPSGWSGWKFWQYADNGSVSGISGNVDMDKFNGSLNDLKAWANETTDAGAPPPADAGAKDASVTDSGASTGDGGTQTGSDAGGNLPTPDAGATNPCGP